MNRRYFLQLSLAATAASAAGCDLITPEDDDTDVDTDTNVDADTNVDTDTSLGAFPTLNIDERHLDWDTDGNLYEVLPLEHSVRRLTDAEEVVWEVTDLNHPAGILHAPVAGHIYVMDQGNSQIVVLDSETGEFEGTISEHGEGDEQTGHTVDAAIDDLGQIVLVDPLNHRLQIFTSTGEYVSGFGGFGTESEHHLNWPRAIAIDHEQHIHVADRGNRRIQVFDEAGNWVRQYGDDTLESPRAIAIDADGRSFVADSHSGTIHVFDVDGGFLDSLPITIDGFPAHPTHLNWMPDGGLHVRVSEHRQQAE